VEFHAWALEYLEECYFRPLTSLSMMALLYETSAASFSICREPDGETLRQVWARMNTPAPSPQLNTLACPIFGPKVSPGGRLIIVEAELTFTRQKEEENLSPARIRWKRG
jgi:hypothetical protein